MPHSIILDPPSEEILDDLVRSGRYGSESEAVSEALRLLRAREVRRGEIRQAWREGIVSGGYEPVEDVLDRLEERYGAEPACDD